MNRESGGVHGVGVAASGGIEGFGEAEIEDLYGAVVAYFDVRGLQVAMDDALTVRGFERFGDLDARWPRCQ